MLSAIRAHFIMRNSVPNVKRYLDNTTETYEGVIYHNNEAFESHNGICHISEYSLETLENALERGEDFTDDELVEMGIADTYQTIIDMVQERWEDFDDEIKRECTVEDVARTAFNDAEWCCVATQIDQMTY